MSIFSAYNCLVQLLQICTVREVKRLYSDYKKKKGRRIRAGCMLLLIGMTCLCIALEFMHKKEKEQEKPAWGFLWLQKQITETYMPVFSFIEENSKKGGEEEWTKKVLSLPFLIYEYLEGQESEYVSAEDSDTLDLLIRQEGRDEEYKEIEEGGLEYEEDALHIDGDLAEAMLEENKLHNEKKKADEKAETEKNEDIKESTAPFGEFVKAEERAYEYDWESLTEYEDIVSAFYAIDKTTAITDSQLNLESLKERDMTIKGSAENPQILIYHTHSQEAFADSVPGDTSTTIVGAGDRLADILSEEYGFHVIHHRGEYDVEARDYAYSNALPAIEQVLTENPTIEVVIDLHRDAVAEGRKLVINLQGRPTAQFMFFNGLSRSRQKGDISYLENPYIDDNLALSFQAQVASNEYYPGIARRIYLKAYRYNMHLRPKSLLIELGAQSNTVEEAMNACEPLAHVLAIVLGALQ